VGGENNFLSEISDDQRGVRARTWQPTSFIRRVNRGAKTALRTLLEEGGGGVLGGGKWNIPEKTSVGNGGSKFHPLPPNPKVILFSKGVVWVLVETLGLTGSVSH